jgi:hypothetical protein
MNWDEFKAAVPELAEAGEKLFERVGVVLVGTLRKDGSWRVGEPVKAFRQPIDGSLKPEA